jgi:serine/threonine protein kinase
MKGWVIDLINGCNYFYMLINYDDYSSINHLLIFGWISQVAAIFKIGNSKDIPDIPNNLSSEAKSFLKLCLQRDPAARPTAAQLMDHPFVKDQATVRSSRSSITRDMFPNSTDGKNSRVRHPHTASDFGTNIIK